MDIRGMVEEALGITPEEQEQFANWREKAAQQKNRNRQKSAFGHGINEFAQTAQGLGQELYRMDMQAQIQSERMAKMYEDRDVKKAEAKKDSKDGDFEM